MNSDEEHIFLRREVVFLFQPIKPTLQCGQSLHRFLRLLRLIVQKYLSRDKHGGNTSNSEFEFEPPDDSLLIMLFGE